MCAVCCVTCCSLRVVRRSVIGDQYSLSAVRCDVLFAAYVCCVMFGVCWLLRVVCRVFWFAFLFVVFLCVCAALVSLVGWSLLAVGCGLVCSYLLCDGCLLLVACRVLSVGCFLVVETYACCFACCLLLVDCLVFDI